MTSTIRKNKREISACFKQLPSDNKVAQFCYTEKEDLTLLSYNWKKKRIIFLLSSLSLNTEMNYMNNKLKIVLFYNKKRRDIFVKKCHDFSTVRKTRRWPLRFFYGMLDQTNVNSYVLYSLRDENPLKKRTDFILDLCFKLLKPILRRRLQQPGIHSRRSSFSWFNRREIEKRMWCGYCPHYLDRKT